jgi:hypothetical protein
MVLGLFMKPANQYRCKEGPQGRRAAQGTQYSIVTFTLISKTYRTISYEYGFRLFYAFESTSLCSLTGSAFEVLNKSPLSASELNRLVSARWSMSVTQRSAKDNMVTQGPQNSIDGGP